MPNNIYTVAGSSAFFADSVGDGLPATMAVLKAPSDILVTAAGGFYIADSNDNRVRFVHPTTRIISTVVGTGAVGTPLQGDGGPATLAPISTPRGLCMDATGSLLVSEGNFIRRVNASGFIAVFAGCNVCDPYADGNFATAVPLSSPWGLAFDAPSNTVYIADMMTSCVRAVNYTTGSITTLAGSNSLGQGYSGDDGPASIAQLSFPTGLALGAGLLFIADTENSRIRAVNLATGIITTYAGSSTAGFSGDHGPATSATLDRPVGISVGPSGLWIAVSNSNAVRFVDNVTQNITTTAGNVSSSGFYPQAVVQAGLAEFNAPLGVYFSAPSGLLYIADSGNNACRVYSSALLTPSSSPTGTPVPSSTPYCAPSLYRSLPRTDVMGTLVGNAWSPGAAFMSSSDTVCRQACCDSPLCDAYTFASSELQFAMSQGSNYPVGQCFLYNNVTNLVPNSGYTSGALFSVYS